MEHRYSHRVLSDTKLFMYERGAPVAIGRCKNASRFGLFVETDHVVYPHQPLEIELIRGHQRSDSHTQRIKCYVVHICGNGFGVEVDEDQINLFGAIASTRTQIDASDAALQMASMAHLCH